MKKSCPGQESHPPSRGNFTERLYERKLTPLLESRAGFAMTTVLTHGSARLSLTELTRLGEPKYSYGEKLARLRGRPYHRKRVTRLGG